jgi:hypothetical protein
VRLPLQKKKLRWGLVEMTSRARSGAEGEQSRALTSWPWSRGSRGGGGGWGAIRPGRGESTPSTWAAAAPTGKRRRRHRRANYRERRRGPATYLPREEWRERRRRRQQRRDEGFREGPRLRRHLLGKGFPPSSSVERQRVLVVHACCGLYVTRPLLFCFKKRN